MLISLICRFGSAGISHQLVLAPAGPVWERAAPEEPLALTRLNYSPLVARGCHRGQIRVPLNATQMCLPGYESAKCGLCACLPACLAGWLRACVRATAGAAGRWFTGFLPAQDLEY